MRRQLRPILILALLGAFYLQDSAAFVDGLVPPMRTDVELADSSSDIFTGTIDEIHCCGIANGGQFASQSIEAMFDCAGPCVEYSTDHTVTITGVLLGPLKVGDVVSVEQNGGTMDGDAQYYEGDGPMAVGEEYLFVTVHHNPPGWYSIRGPGQGNVLLDGGEARVAEIERWQAILSDLPCEIEEAIALDGVVYGRHQWSIGEMNPDSSLVGRQIGEVERSVPDANPCKDELNAGDATWLPTGTTLHEVAGYQPTFRVAAALADGSHGLYEVLWNPHAAIAGDLFDIRGRVESVGQSNYTECVDPVTCVYPPPIVPDLDVETVVELFLASPLVPAAIIHDSYKGTHTAALVFHLIDGSYMYVRWGGASNATLNGIMLDYQISQMIHDARW